MASEFLWCAGYMAEHVGLDGFVVCVWGAAGPEDPMLPLKSRYNFKGNPKCKGEGGWWKMELFCLIFVQTGSSAMFLWALLSLVISTSNWITWVKKKNEISWEKDGNQNNSQFWAGVSQRQGKTIGILLFFLKYQNASHRHSQAEAVCFTKDQ